MRGLRRATPVLLIGLAPVVAHAEPSRAEDPMYDPPEPRAAEPTRGPGGAADGSGRSQPESPGDDLPRLEGAALKNVVPDLEITSWPPPIRLTFAMGATVPFQLAGLGIGVEGYVGESVRLSAFYSGGLAVSGATQLLYSNYAEALIGVKLFGYWRRAQADAIPPREQGFWGPKGPEKPPVLKAWLPAHGALLVEAGVTTGLIPMERCTASCPPSTTPDVAPTYAAEEPQLLYLRAGVRYVYSFGARSLKQPLIDRSFVLQAFAHAIYKPFFMPNGALVWGKDKDDVERQLLGGEGGVAFPFCARRCPSLSIAAGYLPVPATPIFDLSLGF